MGYNLLGYYTANLYLPFIYSVHYLVEPLQEQFNNKGVI